MELIILGVAAAVIVGFILMAVEDRKAARKAGTPTGSLYWHWKEAQRKEQVKKEAKKAKKAEKQREKSNNQALTRAGFKNLPANVAPAEPETLSEESAPVKPSASPMASEPFGTWRQLDTPLVEFYWLGKSQPVCVHVDRVCDSHLAGTLESDPVDAPERTFALDDIQGSVRFPLVDRDVPVARLLDHLLTYYPGDHLGGDDAFDDAVVAPAKDTGNLRFIYRDADGNESTRELTNFTLTAGKVRGYCLDREAIRTFKLDRVVTFLEGEERLYASEGAAPRRINTPDPVRSGDPEIAFSGFDVKTRSELEQTAKAHGFTVRKSVTKNLDYFVAGPRRSGSKMIEAEDKPGCRVIDKEGFLWLVATGEVRS